MTRPSLLLVVPALALTSTASADFYSHRYAGVSFGSAEQTGFCDAANRGVQRFSGDGQSATLSTCGESKNNWKLYAGWRWSPFLAFEGNLQKLEKSELDFQIDFEDGGFLVFEDEIETYLINAYAVGHWPIYEGISLFAKVGGGFWNSELSERGAGELPFIFLQEDGTLVTALAPVSGDSGLTDNGFHYGYGAGLSYRHNNDWTLRAEWESLNDLGSDELRGTFDVNTASLGWSMHF